MTKESVKSDKGVSEVPKTPERAHRAQGWLPTPPPTSKRSTPTRRNSKITIGDQKPSVEGQEQEEEEEEEEEVEEVEEVRAKKDYVNSPIDRASSSIVSSTVSSPLSLDPTQTKSLWSPPPVLTAPPDYFEILLNACQAKCPTRPMGSEVIPLRPVLRFLDTVDGDNRHTEAPDTSKEDSKFEVNLDDAGDVGGFVENQSVVIRGISPRDPSFRDADIDMHWDLRPLPMKRPKPTELEDDDDEVECTGASPAGPGGTFNLGEMHRRRRRRMDHASLESEVTSESSLQELQEIQGMDEEMSGHVGRVRGSGSTTLDPRVHGRILELLLRPQISLLGALSRLDTRIKSWADIAEMVGARREDFDRVRHAARWQQLNLPRMKAEARF